MAVFKIHKTQDYTVMSNYHLKDHNLTLKSKGLLSMMLSLPDEWNYTIRGLASICKEGVDAIGTALQELEREGYITRRQLRGKNGRITDTEYTIYERPQDAEGDPDPGTGHPPTDSPSADPPHMDSPYAASPHTENPDMVKPYLKKPAELNTNLLSTNQSNTNRENIESNRINARAREDEIDPSPYGQEDAMRCDNQSAYNLTTDNHSSERMDVTANDTREGMESPRREKPSAQLMADYKSLIQENIGYDSLAKEADISVDELDELVDIMVETVCATREHIRIAGNDVPAEVVKAKFLKLDAEHIRYVMQSLRRNTTKVRNIRQYILTSLYNAPSTIGNYYLSAVNNSFGDIAGSDDPYIPVFAENIS